MKDERIDADWAPICPPRVVSTTNQAGDRGPAFRAVVGRYRGGPAELEVALWIPGDGTLGKTMFVAVGLEAARAFSSALRQGVKDLENVSPRMP